jgi:ribonucleoside-diphosphate reductase alpha chain
MLGETRLIMSAAREVSLIGESGPSVPDNETEPTERSATERGCLDDGLSPAIRRRLPDERQALTHQFSIAGQEGYLTVGVYEDGLPGEIFITISKQGSTISGLMDSFATAVSLALQ